MKTLRFNRNLTILFWVFVCSAAVGAMIGLSRAQEDTALESALWGMLTGTIIGVGGTLLEFAVFENTRLRMFNRLPVALLLVLRAIMYGAIIIVGLGTPMILDGDTVPWSDPEFTEVFLVSGMVAFGFSIGIEVLRQLGGDATIALFTGRYMRPRIEDRVILFADLVGSTALAERIGELQFYAFLQEVALDLSDPIEFSKGRVHRYVGDAVIVTWPLHTGLKPTGCLQCATHMHQVLSDKAESYRSRFGTAPKLRIAIHCGPIAAGEIGAWKKELTFLGDAMNTAARIESAARDLKAATAVSDDLVQRLPDADKSRLHRLPDYTAHGKSEPLVLWAPAT